MNQKTIRVSATSQYEVSANKITIHFTHLASKPDHDEAYQHGKDLTDELQRQVRTLSPKSYPFEVLSFIVKPKSLPGKDVKSGEGDEDSGYQVEVNAAFDVPLEEKLLEEVLRLLEKAEGTVWFEYGLNDPTFAKQLALKHAIEEAKDKEEEIALAMKGKLGEIVAVESDAGVERCGLKLTEKGENPIAPNQALHSIVAIFNKEVSISESVTVTYNVE